MWYYNADHPLRRFFGGLTEHAFVDDLGVADPALIDYLAILLARFIHIDAVHRFQARASRDLDQVADMLMDIQAMPPEGRTTREAYRHIGDFTLFWTGVYPEGLKKLKNVLKKDHFIDYCEQGKRSYYLASTYEDDPYREEAPVLRRISEQFELCAFGLNKVRHEWEKGNRKAPG